MNAIILAAGMGSRLAAITRDIPKPLIRINEYPIIEQQILFLKEVDIDEIFIVVGYKAASFEYLVEKYGVRLIYNPCYETYNNIYSVFLCLDQLGNSYVIEGDSFPSRNFFTNTLTTSTYFTGIKRYKGREWLLRSEGNRLTEIVIDYVSEEEADHFIMSGFSYWNSKDAGMIRQLFNRIIADSGNFIAPGYERKYWDHVIYENLNMFSIDIRKIGTSDWFEVDTLTDLEMIRAYGVQ